MISSFRKLWTTAGLIVVVALALFSAPGAFAAGVGGAQFALTNTSAQVSTSSLLVNSVQFRPVSGQQCPISVYYGGVLPQNLLAVMRSARWPPSQPRGFVDRADLSAKAHKRDGGRSQQ